MRRALYTVAAALLLMPAAGCLHHRVPRADEYCGCGGCGGLIGAVASGQLAEACYANHGWRHQPTQLGPEGPPSPTYGYPYYTTRGPRDFLASDPPSLGN